MTVLLENEIETFLKDLREEIISSFTSLETSKEFKRTQWDHKSGGGGEMAVLRGDVFAKAAVNFSAVSGPNFPMKDGFGPFFATGISLITHMANPHAPTVHMNIRYIKTEKMSWFGGGYDLTPMGHPYDEDTAHFHSVARKTLGSDLYDDFSARAAEYFFIKHRNKERGVGGIFFDHIHTEDFDADYAMWKSVGNTFLDAIMPIYDRRINMPYSQEDLEKQYELRGHYAEFNLAYDRGTKFGFESGGNTEAILCSLPPIAKW
jgi:coproporphyrinogen III oxidase